MLRIQDDRVVDESEIVAATQPDDDVVLSVRGVSKKFCRDLKRSLLYGVQDIASEMTGLRGSRDELREKEFWALNDVSFELRRGEALGLVGKNGSGKSTLLRVIAGLIKPDSGEVEIRGRVAPLIALGAGFNPILTGRENIYANMSILGLSKEEIDERFDEVLEFAEIGDAIDSPVQSYSSGMAARLGFASAIFTAPDILLVDEVLAVGDIKFQAKCHRELSKLRQNGTTFILVSHNSQTIAGVCGNSVYLNRGKVLSFGDTHQVISQYERDLIFSGNEKNNKVESDILEIPQENKEFSIDAIEIFHENNSASDHFNCGEPARFSINCISSKNIDDIVLRINFYEKLGTGNPILFISNQNDQNKLNIQKGRNQIILDFPQVCFRPGRYTMKVIVRQGPLHTLDFWESYDFYVDSHMYASGNSFYQPYEWKVAYS